MQSIPLAVLKRNDKPLFPAGDVLHAVHTACGIETHIEKSAPRPYSILHAVHTACGIETLNVPFFMERGNRLHAVHTACGIETLHGQKLLV